MENQKIQELIQRFSAGVASDTDLKALEQLVASGTISLDDLEDLHLLEDQVNTMDTPLPSAELDDRFYRMLAVEKEKNKSFSWKHFFSWPEFAPTLAMASITLVLGLFAGYFFSAPTPSPRHDQIETLSQQVTDLREMMMFSLLEKGSATDRLKAVNLTQEMNEASVKVTNALIQTLNEDENVNVRLAALDALKPYVRNSQVRQALIRSIALQESPLVQISMAELMAALHEKSAVREFEKIVASDKTPEEVKQKIRESIQVLI